MKDFGYWDGLSNYKTYQIGLPLNGVIKTFSYYFEVYPLINNMFLYLIFLTHKKIKAFIWISLYHKNR